MDTFGKKRPLGRGRVLSRLVCTTGKRLSCRTCRDSATEKIQNMAPFKYHLYRPIKSKLNSRLRCYGLTAKDVIEIRELESQIRTSIAIKLAFEASPFEDLYLREIAELSGEIRDLLRQLHAVKAAPLQLQRRANLIVRKYLKIDDLVDEESRVMINFRFINKDQLKQLYNAFQFPDKLRYKLSGNTFTGEEVFLAGLGGLTFRELRQLLFKSFEVYGLKFEL